MNRPMPSATIQPMATSHGFCGVEVMCGVAPDGPVKVSRPAVSINRYELLARVGDSRTWQEDVTSYGPGLTTSRRVVRRVLPGHGLAA
jgi:hypothetical protein